MTHGKSRPGIETISAKVPIPMKEQLDRIAKQLNLTTRSEVIIIALKEFISRNSDDKDERVSRD